jgi:Pyruvate/2-oxoacid:ferredoxin oxidoreductase gamma subunit
MTGAVTLQAVVRAIGQKFSGDVADRNMLAANDAHEYVQREISELMHA